MKYVTDYNLHEKRVFLRLDLNTPIVNGRVSNDERITRSLKTINYVLGKKGRLTILSHLGRPKGNGFIQPEFSLKPVADRLASILERKVPLIDTLKNHQDPTPGDLVLLENIRFLQGEKENDQVLSKQLASMCDIYVMDAFATSHRAHASTAGVIYSAKDSCGGFLLKQELTALNKVNKEERRPSIAVLGGAKISTKLELINSLAKKMDKVILGGGIANTCLAAQGFEVGTSLIEEDMLSQARDLAIKDNVILPSHVVVANSVDSISRVAKINEIKHNEAIFDIAPESFLLVESIISSAKIILWNGPMGLFERKQFMAGTSSIARMIADSNAFSVGGGGDTIAAAEEIGIKNKIDYMSTAGGAFLEFIEGKNLPAIQALENKNS